MTNLLTDQLDLIKLIDPKTTISADAMRKLNSVAQEFELMQETLYDLEGVRDDLSEADSDISRLEDKLTICRRAISLLDATLDTYFETGEIAEDLFKDCKKAISDAL